MTPELTKLLADVRVVLDAATEALVETANGRRRSVVLLVDRAELADLQVRIDRALVVGGAP